MTKINWTGREVHYLLDGNQRVWEIYVGPLRDKERFIDIYNDKLHTEKIDYTNEITGLVDTHMDVWAEPWDV
jgi:hypothetical protein